MSENAHDFNRHSGPGCIRGGVPPEIVWSQFDSGEPSCLFHNEPRRCISDREYSVARINTLVRYIILEPRGYPCRDEHDFSLFSALRSPEEQLLIDNIVRGELQHLPDSHAASCHQFENEPVSHFCCSENNLADGLLFHNAPVVWLSWAIQLPKHRCNAGILNGGVKIGLDEIEKRFQVGIASVFRLLFASFGYFVQKGKNLLGADPLQLARVSEMPAEFRKCAAIRLDRIFSRNSPDGTQDRLGRHDQVPSVSPLLQNRRRMALD